MEVNLGLRWHLGHGNLAEADEELFRLLQGVRDYGSLSAASKQIGVSYRHAWGLLLQWADRFGHELVVLKRGRGATLSPLGETLLRVHQQAQERITPALRTLEQELAAEMLESIPAAGSSGSHLRVFASHSLILDGLRRLLAAQNVRLDLHFRGSIESLRLLNQGRCDLAGFHIADPPLAGALSHHYAPWLNEADFRLLRVVARNQGLIVAAGNPLGIKEIKHLAQSKARFINRQPESGTRLLLDLIIKQNGIKAGEIAGYNTEEFTHVAVAALVASGAADVGPGIEAAALRFGLDFVPLVRETYFLAVRIQALEVAGIQRLRDVLRSDEFAHEVNALGGYDVSGAGEESTVNEIVGN